MQMLGIDAHSKNTPNSERERENEPTTLQARLQTPATKDLSLLMRQRAVSRTSHYTEILGLSAIRSLRAAPEMQC